MCGIAGIYNINGQPVYINQLQMMSDAMVLRGPDDAGLFIDGPVGFGFRRLSIIDISGGHQPLFNEDKSLCLVFNGEIYNHISLRKELKQLGHKFNTDSDAEVLLHLYEEHGITALDIINGMFGFALYDRRNSDLIIGRDRLGIKPLYYYLSKDVLIFASDVNAIRSIIPSSLDRNSVLEYLTLAYVADDRSMYKGINRIPPACYLRITKFGDTRLVKYWDVPSLESWRGTVSEAQEELLYLLKSSVAMEMQSDVPVGIFLSGGVDSSALVALASQMGSSETLRTYTVNFKGKVTQDTECARLIAKKFNTSHYEIEMGPSAAIDAIKKLAGRLDEPISDSAILPAFTISEIACKEGVKVLLNGAGGDEIFGGYKRHWKPSPGSPAWFAENLPTTYRNLLSLLWTKFDSWRGMRASSPMAAWASSVSGVNLSAFKSCLRDLGDFNRMLEILNREYGGLGSFGHKANYAYKRMELDLRTYLPCDVLALTDKASMAASVECRVPLLDHRLVEFAFSLPSAINLNKSSPKGLFRSVLKSYLPEKVLHREKDGFSAPLGSWLQNSCEIDLKEELIYNQSPIINELFDTKGLVDVIDKNKRHGRSSDTLFSLFLLNIWIKENVK